MYLQIKWGWIWLVQHRAISTHPLADNECLVDFCFCSIYAPSVCMGDLCDELLRNTTARTATIFKADSRLALSQWETVLLCNDVSHWLGANLESALTLLLLWEHKQIGSFHPGKLEKTTTYVLILNNRLKDMTKLPEGRLIDIIRNCHLRTMTPFSL